MQCPLQISKILKKILVIRNFILVSLKKYMIFFKDLQMIKAKNNLNNLLEPLPPSKNEAIIKDLIEENPIFRQSTLIERNSALFNRRVPASPKSVVLKSLQGRPNTNTAKNLALKKP